MIYTLILHWCLFYRSDVFTMKSVVDLEPIRKSHTMSVLHKTRDRGDNHNTLFSDTEEFTCSTPNMSTRYV